MSKYLILCPPVLSPTEPGAGGFLFAAAMAGRGLKTYFYDSSIDYFQYLISKSKPKARKSALYFKENQRYKVQNHSAYTGLLNKELNSTISGFKGWQISLTNIKFNSISPQAVTDYYRYIEKNETPFTHYIDKRVIPYILKNKFDLIGLSISFLSQLYFCVELACKLKKMNVPVSLGGALVKAVLKARHNLPEILIPLFESIQIDDDFVFAEEKFELKNMYQSTGLPEIVVPFSSYLSPGPVFPIITSSGCYYSKCEFCPDKETKTVLHKPEAIFELMLRLRTAAGDRELMFHLVDAAIPPRFLNYLMKRNSIPDSNYYGFLRFERCFLGKSYLRDLSRKGFRMIQWGMESASDSILTLFNKGTHIDRIKKILELSTAEGIKNYLYVLFGLPKETGEDRMLTFNFLKENLNIYDFLNLSIFNLPVIDELEKIKDMWDIEFIEQDAYQGDFFFYLPWKHHDSVPRNEARQFLREHFGKDPEIRDKIRQTPTTLRSDHAVFMEVGPHTKAQKREV